jgi:hypothetical protein
MSKLLVAVCVLAFASAAFAMPEAAVTPSDETGKEITLAAEKVDSFKVCGYYCGMFALLLFVLPR